MLEQFRETLNKVIILDDQEWRIISEAFEIKKVAARQLITEIGNVEDRLYFVIKGVLRLYCLDVKEQKTTIFLFSENHFASCYQSFLTGAPSDQALETLEECILLSIQKENFESLYSKVPKMNVLTRVIAEQRFIHAQHIFTGQISRTPEERYRDFEQTQGNLLLRVPQHIIASFLGITPVSLSRIRNRALKK